MRYFVACVFLLVFSCSQAQQINPVPDYVFRNQMSVGRNAPTDTAAYFSIGPRFGATKGMMPPMVVDTASFSGSKRNGLLIFSVQKNKFLYWDSVRVQWSDMAGSSGSYIVAGDTSSMLTPYLRKVDTSSMLTPYFRKADSSAMLTPYLRKVDTSSMLTSYLRKVDTSSMLTPYLRKIDTLTMLSAYVRAAGYGMTKSGQSLLVDTAAMATRARVQKAVDSLGALIGASGSGTVTSVASGYGLSGGPITTTGTLRVDTFAISTRAWRDKAKDSVQANVALKVNISDTSTMLSNYLRKSDTLTMLSPYIRAAGYGLTKSGQSLIVDTAAMATRARVQKAVDSLGVVIGTKGAGTVTSVATGYGLSGGTITSTGTIVADTAALATRARVQKAVDSLGSAKQNTLTNPVTGTGTTNYLPKFTGTSAIGNSVAYDNGGTELLVNTTSDAGAYALQVAGSIYNTTGAAFAVSSGSVTIGTTSAQTALTVQTAGESRATFIGGSGSGTGINMGDASDFDIGRIEYNNGSDYMALWTNDTEKMRITSDGKVIIGATSSSCGFTVSNAVTGIGIGSAVPQFRTCGGDSNAVYIGHISTNESVIAAGRQLAFTRYSIGSGTWAESMRLNNDGELIINGSDNGNFKLQVQGNAYVQLETILGATGDFGAYTLQVTGATIFDGTITTQQPGGSLATKIPWRLGNVATVTPTSPNRTISVEINGTTYYIHAKTTND